MRWVRSSGLPMRRSVPQYASATPTPTPISAMLGRLLSHRTATTTTSADTATPKETWSRLRARRASAMARAGPSVA